MADTYTVERSTIIDAPSEAVYAHIVDFHKWPEWSPWEDLDPDMTQRYSGAEAGTGAIYSWSGNRKAGKGRMEITDATEPTSVAIALDFLKPFKSSNTTVFDLSPDGDTTRVNWTMIGPNTFMIKVMGIFKSMDSMIGSDFEKGLAQLKAVSERSGS